MTSYQPLTGRLCSGDLERELLSLPPQLGGLGITNPTTLTEEYKYSLDVTAPLVVLITMQSSDSTPPFEAQQAIKKRLQSTKRMAPSVAFTASMKNPRDENMRPEFAMLSVSVLHHWF